MIAKFLSRLLAGFSLVLCFASTLLSGVAFTSTSAQAQGRQPASLLPAKLPTQAPAHLSLSNIPLSFEPNRGQTSAQAQWLSRGLDFTLFLAGHDAVLEMDTITPGKTPLDHAKVEGAALRMNLLGASSTAKSEGREPLQGHANYFHGSDPAKWQRDVPTFGKVKLPMVYPGVDLIYYGRSGHLEYDFVVAPGADPSTIRLGFDGAKPALTPNGDLLLEVAGKKVTLDRPVVYQTSKGSREPVDGSFVIASNNEVTFRLGGYDHSRELTIDPVLIFDGAIGTGNNGDSIAYGMTVDAAGEIIFTGATRDTAFPATPGVIQPTCGTQSLNPATNTRCTSNPDAFITKLSADGASLVFSTYLSGTQHAEYGSAVAVDAAGTIYVVGNTGSDDFPITSDAFQKLCDPTYTNNGQFNTLVPACASSGTSSEDIFLVKINSNGNQLLYGTFVGGSAQDVSTGVALDPAGNIYISGITSSSNPPGPATGLGTLFPVTQTAYQTLGNGGHFSASLSKFSNDGHSLLYSTFFGSPVANSGDFVFSNALALGTNGIAFIGGYAYASDLPTTQGAIKPNCANLSAGGRPQTCQQNTGFVAAFDTTKSGPGSLVYSTYIGPPTNATGTSSHTYVNGLLADASNDVFVTGSTLAYNFPTTSGAYQTSCPFYAPQGDCGAIAYLSKINPTGTAFLFSTFYGGLDTHDTSAGYAIATDAKGRVYLYGSKTGYCDLPVLNPIQSNCQGNNRVFVSAFAPDASQLLFGTEFGSPNRNEAPVAYNGIAVDPGGNIYFGGMTTNPAFPTTAGAYVVPSPGGFQRPFFGKISPLVTSSSTTLTLPTGTITAGQSVKLTVNVTGPAGTTAIPTGLVTFLNGSTTLGTGTLDATGTATYTATSLNATTYSVTASYAGDTTFSASVSAAQNLVVTPATPNVTLTAPASALVGASVTLGVTVTGTGGSPTGSVVFKDGATTLSTANLASGAASYSTSALAIGTHSITASYSGDSIFAATTTPAQSVVVSLGTAAVSLTAPATALVGASVTLATSVTGTGGTPTGTVTFKDGTTTLSTATLASGAASFSTTSLAAGAHSITASYSGDSSFAAATSSASTVTINVAPAITFAASPTTLTIVHGATGTVMITGTPVGGYTGAVTFACGSVPTSASCTFAPTTLSFTGANTAQTTTLTFSTSTTTGMLGQPAIFGRMATTIALAVLLMPLGFARRSRRVVRGAIFTLLLTLGLVAGLSGCSSSGKTTLTTAAGTYTVPVTVTASGVASTINLSVVVQ